MSRWRERLRRLKNKAGHGIHPPFAFRMVSMVTEAKESTYSLDSLLAKLSSEVSSHERHYLSMLYRAVRYMEVSDGRWVGSVSSEEELFIRQAIADRVPQEEARKRNLIFFGSEVNKSAREDVLKLIRQQEENEWVIIVGHLMDSRECRACWKELVEQLSEFPAYDLMDLGVLCLQKGLHTQYFKLYVGC